MDFNGLPYPITKDAQGFFRSANGLDLIKGDLLILLLTNPGERVMMPDFGAGLRNLVFDPNDGSLIPRARQTIINAINNFEPRIIVDRIEVLLGGQQAQAIRQSLNTNDDGGQIDSMLLIKIVFQNKDTAGAIQELRLEVPLEGVAT